MFLLFFVLAFKVSAQFSKTHFIPPITYRIDNSTGLATPRDQYIYISTPSETPVNIKIIEIGGTTYEVQASNANPRHYR